MRRMFGLPVAAGLIAAAIAVPRDVLADPILGSGSTFAHPLIASWSEGILIERGGELGSASPDAGVDFEAVGSVAGMMRMNQPDVDFAATDAALSPEELAARDLAQFPIVVGGLAVVVNLPGVESGTLKLPRAVLADIYLGEITAWSDPGLAAANPGVSLPDMPIAPVARADGSGSTLAFTRYLAAASTEWRDRFGAATEVLWPVGSAVEGSTRVIEAVAATEGAIGYVEFGQASRAGLAVAAVENGASAFVLPSPEAFAKTASEASWSGERISTSTSRASTRPTPTR